MRMVRLFPCLLPSPLIPILPPCSQLDEQTSNDVEVSLADQERINAFSRLNSRAADAEARIAQLRDEKETLGDLEMELELEGEDEVL